MEQVCSTPAIYDLILNDMKELAKHNKLNSLEMPRKIFLHTEVFTEANELITPTQKIKR
jgi:long-subunit acyl-CoA synthetase (AMP-forming)